MVTIFFLKNAISLSQLLYQLFHNFQYIGATNFSKKEIIFILNLFSVSLQNFILIITS